MAETRDAQTKASALLYLGGPSRALGLPHLFLLLFEGGAQGFAVADQLLFQLLNGFGVPFVHGFGDLAFYQEFALGNFGSALRFQVGDLLFLVVSEFDGG